MAMRCEALRVHKSGLRGGRGREWVLLVTASGQGTRHVAPPAAVGLRGGAQTAASSQPHSIQKRAGTCGMTCSLEKCCRQLLSTVHDAKRAARGGEGE